MAAESHPFPSRTRPLSPPAPMVLGGRPPGRVGRRRIALGGAPSPRWGRSFASRDRVARGRVAAGSSGRAPPARRDAWAAVARPPDAPRALADRRCKPAGGRLRHPPRRDHGEPGPRCPGDGCQVVAGRPHCWGGPPGSVPLCRIAHLLVLRALRAAVRARHDQRQAGGGRARPPAVWAEMVGAPVRRGPVLLGRVRRDPVLRGRALLDPVRLGPALLGRVRGRSGAPRSGAPRSDAGRRSGRWPRSGAPRSGAPRSGAARSGAPRSGAPRSSDARSGAPRSGAPRSSDARSGAPRSGAPRSALLAGCAGRVTWQQLGRTVAIGRFQRHSIRVGRANVGRPATQCRSWLEPGPAPRPIDRQLRRGASHRRTGGRSAGSHERGRRPTNDHRPRSRSTDRALGPRHGRGVGSRVRA